MRVLLAGARGQLGRECESVLAFRHELVTVDLPECDITRRDQVVAVVRAVHPDAIVNCAAYTAVDRAETDRQAAHAVNAGGAQILAELAKECGAFLVHISTDYVFDGRKPVPQGYAEDDPAEPVNWYGRTKLAGEQAIREVGPRHAILRTAWLYGRHGRNFPKVVLARALRDPSKPLWVVADQHGSPTWARRLAMQINAVLQEQPEGVFHAAGVCRATWHDLATEFFRRMGLRTIVEPCATRDQPRPAARPTNSVLHNVRLSAAGLDLMRPWFEDLEEFARRHGDELRKEAASAAP